MEKCYISYMANDRDIKGILVNNFQLQQVHSKYPYVCLCTKDVSKKVRCILKHFNIHIIDIQFHNILRSFHIDDNKIDYLYSKYYWGKLFIFLVEVKQCIYLDSDLLLLKNIDHLFDKDTSDNRIYMTNDLVLESIYENNISVLINKKNAFNSGVIVYSPNRSIFNKMGSYIHCTSLQDIQRFWRGDQILFNEFHAQKIFHIHPLHHKYNMILNSLHYFINILDEDDLHIIHYTLSPKPWSDDAYSKQCSGIEQDYWIKWGEIYNTFIKHNLQNYPITCSSIKDG